MRLCKHGKKPSIAFIKYFWQTIPQRKENADYLLLDQNRFSPYVLIVPTHIWQHITNQNSCHVTTMFTYSHLNTPIDQWERMYYPNYFINNIMMQVKQHLAPQTFNNTTTNNNDDDNNESFIVHPSLPTCSAHMLHALSIQSHQQPLHILVWNTKWLPVRKA